MWQVGRIDEKTLIRSRVECVNNDPRQQLLNESRVNLSEQRIVTLGDGHLWIVTRQTNGERELMSRKSRFAWLCISRLSIMLLLFVSLKDNNCKISTNYLNRQTLTQSENDQF